ncbi:DUF4236 domain-containing protein [Bradyrhizobium sp. 157]|uniref:DUF4236 domain-containing protein n=1 Tax=Bradyrhizobium sp. 157 TaxID=2782631 RepID=UPI001FFC12C8|nr:DUF4236 domain-containing protein [Bradyrhizobium sp. 157]
MNRRRSLRNAASNSRDRDLLAHRGAWVTPWAALSKDVSIVPGVKLNIGKRTASVRVAMKGFGYTTGTAGQTVSASLPGSGLSVSHKFKSGKPVPQVPTISGRRRPVASRGHLRSRWPDLVDKSCNPNRQIPINESGKKKPAG